MTVKFFDHHREVLCDHCHTTFIYAEDADYTDNINFYELLMSLGWKKIWLKKEGRYKHVCYECKAKANEQFRHIREQSEHDLYSLSDAPYDIPSK